MPSAHANCPQLVLTDELWIVGKIGQTINVGNRANSWIGNLHSTFQVVSLAFVLEGTATGLVKWAQAKRFFSKQHTAMLTESQRQLMAKVALLAALEDNYYGRSASLPISLSWPDRVFVLHLRGQTGATRILHKTPKHVDEDTSVTWSI